MGSTENFKGNNFKMQRNATKQHCYIAGIKINLMRVITG